MIITRINTELEVCDDRHADDRREPALIIFYYRLTGSSNEKKMTRVTVMHKLVDVNVIATLAISDNVRIEQS